MINAQIREINMIDCNSDGSSVRKYQCTHSGVTTSGKTVVQISSLLVSVFSIFPPSAESFHFFRSSRSVCGGPAGRTADVFLRRLKKQSEAASAALKQR